MSPAMYTSIARLIVCLGLLLAICERPLVLMAQQTSEEPQTDGRQASPPLVLPAPLGGFTPTVTASESTSCENLLTGGVGVNALFSDNSFSASPTALNHSQYSITPEIGLEIFGLHTQWLLDYAGGLTLDQGALGNTQQRQAATVDVRHNFTQRLAGEVREHYTMSNNPFAQVGENPSLPTLTGPGQLSPFAVPSPVTQMANVSTANLTYR